MGFIVPNPVELATLNERLTLPWTLRLYGNDVTPTGGTTAAGLTEISGGGYANKAITLASWTITPAAAAGDAPQAVTPTQAWTFTGAISLVPTGAIYGYYATRDSDGTLMIVERFAAAVVPFIPEAGSQVRILLRYTVTSAF
jgi:hypothetical protein